jgi:hypothetical protein
MAERKGQGERDRERETERGEKGQRENLTSYKNPHDFI